MKVQSSKDGGAVTIQTAGFFVLDTTRHALREVPQRGTRALPAAASQGRANKVVTKSGTYDGTFRYLYDGQKIIGVRNGSGQMVQQFLHGTQYIDELIMVRVKDKGDLYVHQDANWNVIGTTDLGRHVVEHNFLSPYGELTVNQETGFGDRDGDGNVDSTDKGTVGTTCTGTVAGSCRILDLDFDGDYDSTDATKFDALTQGAMRSPGRKLSAVEQPFAHQGLLFEAEIASYQNRARQFLPAEHRFLQRNEFAQQVAGVPVFSSRGFSLTITAYAGSPPRPFFTMTTSSWPNRGLNLTPMMRQTGRRAHFSHNPRSVQYYPDGLNLYSYVQANPIVHLDPYGECSRCQDAGRKCIEIGGELIYICTLFCDDNAPAGDVCWEVCYWPAGSETAPGSVVCKAVEFVCHFVATMHFGTGCRLG